MAVPKRKQGRHSVNSRRSANMKLKSSARSICDQCGSVKRPHHVCPNCGYYKGREILEVE